jgi:Holliday junction resolvasome RuvABC DNA-binding subunit
LEQVSSHSFDLARSNYSAALKKVGFSNEEIEALLKDISEDKQH